MPDLRRASQRWWHCPLRGASVPPPERETAPGSDASAARTIGSPRQPSARFPAHEQTGAQESGSSPKLQSPDYPSGTAEAPQPKGESSGEVGSRSRALLTPVATDESCGHPGSVLTAHVYRSNAIQGSKVGTTPRQQGCSLAPDPAQPGIGLAGTPMAQWTPLACRHTDSHTLTLRPISVKRHIWSFCLPYSWRHGAQEILP